MRQLVAKILPVPVLNTLRDLRDRQRLGVVRPLQFDADHLRRAVDCAPLLAAFNDAAIEPSWLAAQAEIGTVLSDIDLYGGVNPGDRRALFYLVTALRPRRVLEVGTHIGASTLYIAQALKRTGGEGTVTTVDVVDVNAAHGPWQQLGLPRAPEANAVRLGCRDRISFRAQSSLAFMQETEERFDLIFLDGDHSANAVYQEVAAGLRLLNPGGVILLHDYYPEARLMYPDGTIIFGPFQALSRIGRENTAIKVCPLGALPWPTKQGSHLTSLALVARQ